jgi:tetratricopeptide (TPR) repeat protein
MSPEQAALSNVDVDTRSDVYALGVLLYELLTGTTPFDRGRLKEVGYDELRRIIREEEPPKPSTRLSTLGQAATTLSTQRQSHPKQLSQLVRGELDWIVMKALEKDRNRRYESASAFAADVQRYLDDEPVLACPPSAGYRLRKFARRNKAVLGITGLVLFFLVLIGSGAGWAVRDRAARQARLNREIEHALEDAAKTRDLALKLTDNPYGWEAVLAEAASELKRAQGLAAQDETALGAALQVRLQGMQTLLDADEADRRFAARFEEILLEQYEVHMGKNETKLGIAFAAFKEAFQRHYGIAFGTTPVEQAAFILQQRPKAMQDILLAALEISLDEHVPKEDRKVRPWLLAVLDAADTGPWRKRAQQAVRASDWKAFEQIFEEAVTTRQPQWLLDRLIAKTPWGTPIHLRLLRRFRQAYPGNFWANHSLAGYLHYTQGQRVEAIRYYTAALALRPHNPVACVNLGNALRDKGDLDGAIVAYREALDGHPDYTGARTQLARTLEKKGDLGGAIIELREGIRLGKHAPDHLLPLGNALFRSGHRDEAIESYKKAVALDPTLHMAHYNLGTALLEKGCPEEAIASFQNAIACQRRVSELNPTDPYSRNELAWFLVTCPHVPLRDPVEGVKLAQRAVELAPDNGNFWNTLGAAHYRAGNWKEAVAALEKSMQLCGGNSYDWFFLAMAHWRLGEKERARQWYDRAVRWMDKNMPKGKEVGRFRTEAAELLKVEKTKD